MPLERSVKHHSAFYILRRSERTTTIFTYEVRSMIAKGRTESPASTASSVLSVGDGGAVGGVRSAAIAAVENARKRIRRNDFIRLRLGLHVFIKGRFEGAPLIFHCRIDNASFRNDNTTPFFYIGALLNRKAVDLL